MPAYVAEYRKKYGSLEGVCKLMSFTDIGKVAADRDSAISADIPSFVRLNQTFGEKASIFWLYTHLKSLLVRFLVDEKKMSDEQIEFLASVIATNHPTMKLTEFMLFESYFLGGRYQEFYGENSYILAITRSLQQFKKDLNTIYWQIERDKENARKAVFTPGVSWEQYCKDNGMEGKPYPGTLQKDPVKVQTLRKQPSAMSEVRVGVNSAHAVLDNTFRLDKVGVAQLRNVFQKRYGCSPEEYLKKHEEVVIEK